MTKSYDPFNPAPWADPYRNYTTTTTVPTIATSKVEVDPHKLEQFLRQVDTRIHQLEMRVHSQGRALDDLQRLVEFTIQNPGSTTDDWVAYEKVKHTITEAAKIGDTDGKKNR